MIPDTSTTIAVLVPCYNEEPTIGKVVDDFRRELPNAAVVVFDNISTDRSAEVALAHGAVVLKEPRQGKGFVVQSMFERVDADVLVMVDGDDTYPAERVHDLLAPVLAGEADMCVGARLSDYTQQSFRPLHVAGNKLVRSLVNLVGGASLTDIMSGYRAFNRRVADRLPVISAGFEVETEMTIQMLYYRLRIVEVQVPYRERVEGSESKLRTVRDGVRVLWKIFTLFRSFKPLTFFGGLGFLLLVAGLAAGVAPISDYVVSRFVHHVPRAILASGLVLLAGMSAVVGLLLHAFNWRLMELHSIITRRPRHQPSRQGGAVFEGGPNDSPTLK